MSDTIKKELASVISSMAEGFAKELFGNTREELETYWHFKWEDTQSSAWNTYQFHDSLRLYGGMCRRWEEHHNGSCCVVGRIRDKYLLPKIREFLVKLKEMEASK